MLVPLWLFFPMACISVLFSGCLKKVERRGGQDLRNVELGQEMQDLGEQARVNRRRELIQATKCSIESEQSV